MGNTCISNMPTPSDSSFPENVYLETVPCVCGSSQVDSKFSITAPDYINKLKGNYRIVRCSQCGLMRTNPRPDRKSIHIYYPSSYSPYSHQPYKATLLSKLINVLAGSPRKLPHISPGKALELGCSSGAFLEVLRDQGWDALGLDVSPEPIRIANSRGLSARQLDFSDFPPTTEKYNLICAWMVLEHLHDPISAFKFIHDSLDDNGYFLCSVPDMDSLLVKLFGKYTPLLHLPNHLFHFNEKTLSLHLSHAGFKIVNVRRPGSPTTLLNSLYTLSIELNIKSLRTLSIFLLSRSPLATLVRLILSFLSSPLNFSGKMEIWAQKSS